MSRCGWLTKGSEKELANDKVGMGKTEVRQPYAFNFPKKAKVLTPDARLGDGLLFED